MQRKEKKYFEYDSQVKNYLFKNKSKEGPNPARNWRPNRTSPVFMAGPATLILYLDVSWIV